MLGAALAGQQVIAITVIGLLVIGAVITVLSALGHRQ